MNNKNYITVDKGFQILSQERDNARVGAITHVVFHQKDPIWLLSGDGGFSLFYTTPSTRFGFANNIDLIMVFIHSLKVH